MKRWHSVYKPKRISAPHNNARNPDSDIPVNSTRAITILSNCIKASRRTVTRVGQCKEVFTKEEDRHQATRAHHS